MSTTTTSTTQHHTSVTKSEEQGWRIDCDTCGLVGYQDYQVDAEAIADRHAEIGGFER